MVTVAGFLNVQRLLIVPDISIVIGLVTILEIVTVQEMVTIQAKICLATLQDVAWPQLCYHCHPKSLYNIQANWNRQAGGQTNLGIGMHAPPKMKITVSPDFFTNYLTFCRNPRFLETLKS